MTGTYVPAKAVQEAEADVGFHEGNNNWNPYSLWQYGNPNNPYCNSAACKWAYDAGFRFWSNCTYGEKGEAYTPTYKIKAQEHGVWRSKYWKANPGDDVEFDWGNNGMIDHVEKVVSDDGTTIITVGANTSNGVYYRRRDRSYVAGFVALSEAGQTVAAPPPPFKVRPMYDPPRPLRALLMHPDGVGWWLGFSSGRVLFVRNDGAKLEQGMMNAHDVQAFAGRILSRLEPRPYNVIENGVRVLHHGFTIVATSGEEYVPS